MREDKTKSDDPERKDREEPEKGNREDVGAGESEPSLRTLLERRKGVFNPICHIKRDDTINEIEIDNK